MVSRNASGMFGGVNELSFLGSCIHMNEKTCVVARSPNLDLRKHLQACSVENYCQVNTAWFKMVIS